MLSPFEWILGHCSRDLSWIPSSDGLQRLFFNIHILEQNAYVMCAMRGRPLLSSARKTYDLVTNDALGVFALSNVITFLFMMIKLLVTVTVGSTGYLYFTNIDAGIHLVTSPVLVIMLGTYLIAHVFFSVYSVAVETLFICACMYHILLRILPICRLFTFYSISNVFFPVEDCKRNDGSEESPYFLPRPLMKILSKKLTPKMEEQHTVFEVIH